MAAPPFMGTAFFHKGIAGWSEVYWLIQPNYAAALSALQTVVTARLGLSGPDVFADAIRVSDPFVFRDVALTVYSTPQPGTWVFATGEQTIPIEESLRLRQFAGVKPFSLRWVHGIPSGQVAGNNFVPTVPYAGSLAAYVGSLESNTVLIIRKGVVPPGPYPAMPISAITPENIRSRRVGRPFGLFRGRRLPR